MIDSFSDAFQLNIDQLKKGKNENISQSVPSEVLDINETYMHFHGTVDFQGEAYVVDNRLILHLDVVAHAVVPCTICNGDADVEVKLYNFYHAEDLDKVTNPIYDFRKLIREEMLLECPQYSECNEGSCPEREVINQYLRKRKEKDEFINNSSFTQIL